MPLSRTPLFAAVCLVALVLTPLALAGAQAEPAARPDRAIAVTVLDAAGKPAPGVTLAGMWAAGGYRGQGDLSRMLAVGPTWKTGPDGVAEVRMRGRRGPYASDAAVTSFFAFDAKQEFAALAVVAGKSLGPALTLKLEPVITVRGRLWCARLKRAPAWANGYVFANTPDGKGSIRVAASPTTDGTFKLKLPPGQYRQNFFGAEVEAMPVDLGLYADARDHDLGTVELEPNGIARAYGKAPPDWWVKEARGIPADRDPVDYQGKWLLVIYWAWW